MDDFWKSFTSWLKEKTTSPLYFTYIAFFIVWNWRLFHVLFWEDSSLFKGPRVEYVSSNLEFHLQSPVLGWLFTTGWHVLPPAILTYLSVKYLPWLYMWAYSIHLENYFQRRDKFDSENLEYERKRTQRLKRMASQKVEQKAQIEKIEKTQTKEEKWLKELQDISSQTTYTEAVRAAYGAIYKTNGRFTPSPTLSSPTRTYIQPDYLSRLDTLGLVEIASDRGLVSFTEKGKFFLKELQRQNKVF